MLGLFRKLTSKRSGSPAHVELRSRDCHTHVIPGVDDGSRTMSESLQMLAMLQAAGVRHVIATPHIFPGRFDNEPEPLREAFDGLHEAMQAEGLALTLELGAEHYLDDKLMARVQAGRVLSFGPERYVLFETTTGVEAPPNLMDVAFALVDEGYTPLMAHVERYRYLRGEEGPDLLEDLRAAGVRFQVNRTVAKEQRNRPGSRATFIASLLERGWVDEVGSDLHRASATGRPEQPHRAA